MDALKPLADQAAQFLGQLLDAKVKTPESYASAAGAAKLPVKETGEFEAGQTERCPGKKRPSRGLRRRPYKLTKENPDSDVPLETPDAFYDLHLSGVVPERPLTLDEARPKIVAAIKDERATAALAAKAEEMRGKIVEALQAGQPLADAAKAVGQTVQLLPAFSVAEPARGLPDAGMVANTAQELGPNELSKFVPTSAGGLFVYVRARQGIDEAKFDKDKEMVTMNLRRQKAGYYFYEWLRSIREAAGAELDSRVRA